MQQNRTQKNTPLWLMANGKVDRQNQGLLKNMIIAHIEEKQWKRELNKYLLAYRSTSHKTTGASPAELLFCRTIIQNFLNYYMKMKLISEMGTMKTKQAAKDYADKKRHATNSDIQCAFTAEMGYKTLHSF